jgi:integrase/recombinase XerD
MTNSEIVEEYATWLASWSPSKATLRSRRCLAGQVLKLWGVDGMTAANIQSFLAAQQSPWTRTTYHSSLVDFCAWLVAAGYLAANPMPDVRKPKRPRSVPKPLADAEVSKILANAKGPMREWVQLGLLAGLRAHEIAKIRGEDVSQTHIYVEGKGEVRAMIPTHPDIWALALAHDNPGYWYPGSDDGHVRANYISIEVGKFFRSLGITGSIHRARHTYGTRLLRAGTNIRIVQKLMRHASLATTEAYTAVSDDELTAAIGRLSA